MPGLLERLQAALEGTYLLDRELGGGGMSRVFVAEEVALDRQVVIKVLPDDLARGLSAERFRREILVAAKLQHPHIVPLLAAGEADGLLFYTMPFIQGESLRARLDRAHELPAPEAVRIVREVADALAYAHRHGVVHRDIKPGNVLLAEGHAVVADFGVAKALSEAVGGGGLTSVGLALGTPAYMAPEQAAADPRADHRADLYSLGVVAYEMLTGRLPFTDTSPQRLLAAHVTRAPEPIRQVLPSLSPTLADVVMHCLEKRPADRWQRAEDLIAALDAASAAAPAATVVSGAAGATPGAGARTRALRRIAAGAALALGALGVALASGAFRPRSLVAAGALAEREPVLIADFENRTADSTLAGTVTEAFRVDLTQSAVITTVSPEQVRETLERMRRDSVRTLDLALAREVALRDGIKAIITGEVAALGDQYVISARLVSAERGEVLAAFRETASEPSRIITAVDRLSKELRGRVGESVRSLRAAPPLEQVSTASLEALRKYSQGIRAARRGDIDASRAALEEAVRLDSTFASAWRALGITLANRNEDPRRRDSAFTLAYRLRDRLSERERYLAEAAYYSWVDLQRDRVITAYRAVLDANPNDRVALTNLALQYDAIGDLRRAQPLLERALAVDSGSIGFLNLAGADWGLGDTARTDSLIALWRRKLPDDPLERVATALLDAARGRYDSARAVGDRLRDQQRESAFFVRSATQFLRAVALVQGRLADGDRLTGELERSGADTAGTEHDAVPATVRAMMDVQYRRTPAGGVRRLQDYVRSARFERPDPLDRPYLATAQVYAMAGRADLARPMVDAFDRAVAAAADAGARQRARLAPAYADAQATIAIAEGRPDSAIALLRQPQPLRTEFWSLPLLGRAYDAAGRSDSAIAVFERYLRTPQMERVFLDQWALAPVLRRLGELYEARGDRERAREYYGRFVDLWKGADPELQPQVRDIKRRIGELTREPSES